MTISNQKSYKSILKTTSIFGSTQLFQMIIMLLRSKVTAVLLGPLGMGLNSIFQTSILTISQFSSFGVFQSGVKEISQYNNNGEIDQLSKSIHVFARISNILAIGGVILFAILSYPLSIISFGSSNYTISFFILSVAILFYTLSQKQITIMQGTRQVKNIALSSLISAICSLLTCLFMYYQFGINGIIPALISSYIFQYIIVHKLIIIPVYTGEYYSLKRIFKEGRPLLNLGIVLMLSGFLINLFILLLNAFINKLGNPNDVGLFNSAFSITNGNVLILMSILASDYFPRLSASVHDNEQSNIIVNQQAELMALITGPIAVMVVIFSDLIVKLLLSNEFLVIIPMLKLMSLALLFRIIWQSMSYIILSRGDKKVYFLYDALIGNGITFLSNVISYAAWGLEGLGYSFVFSSIIVSIILTVIVNKKYNIVLSKQFIYSFSILLLLSMGSFALSLNNNLYLFAIGLWMITCIYSIYIIQKRVGLNFLSLIRSKLFN